MEKLLIVDDEEPIRRLLRMHLSDRYDIIETGDPARALALVMIEKPNVILLDLRMPKYSGYELCQTLHSLSFTQLIPIIIVTGEGGANTKSLCASLGATAFFEKPIDFEALRAGLESVLSVAKRERRNEMRVSLHVPLTLRGADASGKPFQEASITENVSRSGFLCGCTTVLKQGATIEIEMGDAETKFTARARVVRTEACETHYPRYAFRIIEKNGEWILN